MTLDDNEIMQTWPFHLKFNLSDRNHNSLSQGMNLEAFPFY